MAGGAAQHYRWEGCVEVCAVPLSQAGCGRRRGGADREIGRAAGDFPRASKAGVR